MARIRLVVGLGNPGNKYSETRHNIGFTILDELVGRLGISFSTKQECSKDRINFLKPQDFMNLSGIAVRNTAHFYQIKSDEILVIHDELDLSLGDIRVKLGGGNAGHNGLHSIQEHLGTANFYRCRFGIGRPTEMPVVNWVLGRFSGEEKENMDKPKAKLLDALETFLFKDFTLAEIQAKIKN